MQLYVLFFYTSDIIYVFIEVFEPAIWALDTHLSKRANYGVDNLLVIFMADWLIVS